MTALDLMVELDAGDPLEVMERIASDRDWAHERLSEGELAIECAGQWCDYRIYVCWHEHVQSLHITCSLDMRVPRSKCQRLYELVALVNERLPVGHFDLPSEDPLPVYRATLLLRGQRAAAVEQLEDLVDIALAECERFYPAFQFVLWGGKAPVEAVAVASFDAVGEA